MDLLTPKGNPAEQEPSKTGAATGAPMLAVPSVLQVTEEQLEASEPSEVVGVLEKIITHSDVTAKQVETCCKRLRVLCREDQQRSLCHDAGMASTVVGAMTCFPKDVVVQYQALAALVNLCSGDSMEHRASAMIDGVLAPIVAALNGHREAEVQEMGLIALQNVCYGEDEHGVVRRQGAFDAGAVQAILAAMKHHEGVVAMQEEGVKALRLICHKADWLRAKAIEVGAAADQVRPFSAPASGGGGALSSRLFFGRGGSGTSRSTRRAGGTATPRRGLSLSGMLTPRRARLTPRKGSPTPLASPAAGAALPTISEEVAA